MKLPTIKKILREDVKEAPGWISAIIEPFNSVAETVYQAFNKNITYQENIRCFIKELVVKTTASYPTMDQIEFMNDLKVKATGVQVLQCFERTTYVPVAANVAWVENNGTIVVSQVSGLLASKTYTLRLLIT